MLREIKTNGERNDDEGNTDNETMAVNLKQENEYEAEIIVQERDERNDHH